jgi:lambda family phage tail tape measure protein
MAATQVREIKVVIDTQGDKALQSIAAGFGRVNKSIAQTNGILGGFQNAFKFIQGLGVAVAGFGLVREFVNIADSVQKLTDRLTLSEGSVDGARNTLGKLTGVALATKSSIEDIATVYNRLSLSLRDTGVSTDGLLELTQALQNSFRLSGATASEATAATIQLSQGLASGQLRGQELRSVLEANAEIGDVLSKKLGKTRGELLKFAETNGGISAVTVMEAFAQSMDSINERADKLNPTIGEALSNAFSKFKIKLGEVNSELEITKKAVKVIEFMSNNMAASAIGIGLAVNALKGYVTWAGLSATATTALNAAMASGFVGALVKIGIAVAAFLGTASGMILAVTALAAGFAGLVAFSDKFRTFIKEGAQYIGTFTKLFFQAKGLGEAHKGAAAAVDLAREGQRNYVLETPKLVESFYLIGKASENGYNGVLRHTSALEDSLETVKKNIKVVFDFDKELAKLNQQYQKDGDVRKYNEALKSIKIQDLTDKFLAGKLEKSEFDKKLNEVKYGKAISSLKEYRGELSDLNREFEHIVKAGQVTEYARALEQVKLDKVSRDLKEGRTSFLEFHKDIRTSNLNELNRALVEGSISLDDYRAKSQSIQLAQVNEEWRAGITDIYAYHDAVVKVSDKFEPGSAFFVGTQNFISQAGTLNQNLANGVTQTFQRLEDTFISFTQTGKFAFKEFAMGVLEDLNRIIMRALIIRPLAQGILGAIDTSGASGASMESQNGLGASNRSLAAKGAFFDGDKANFFAKGGIVSNPTGFMYGRGNKGVMGEAGPEAILPLRRDGSGNLGVKAATSPVIVNITNNTGGEVTQTEKTGPNGERILDIIVAQKVKEAFANGTFDKQMSQNYGLRRKGL